MPLPEPEKMGPYKQAIRICRMVADYYAANGDPRACLEALDAYQWQAADSIMGALAPYVPDSEEYISLCLSHDRGIRRVRKLRIRMFARMLGMKIGQNDKLHPDRN